MRILVIGAGAVGGYFGGRLADAGRDVTFLVRAARAEQMQRDGLRIVSRFGDLTLTPKTVVKENIDSFYDVILFGVKSFTFEAAMEDFAAAVGPETMIIPMLNGMRHLDVLAARFGDNAVLGGVSRISADLDKDGRVIHLGALQDFAYGERDGSVTPRMKALEAFVSNAGFDPQLSTNIMELMWHKWVTLSSMASMTCLLRGNIGAISAFPEGEATAHAIIDECAAIAKAAGHPSPEKGLESAHQHLTEKGSDLEASMYRDVKKGARVEVDHVLGDFLARGKALGVATPLLQAAYTQLAIYQARFLRGEQVS